MYNIYVVPVYANGSMLGLTCNIKNCIFSRSQLAKPFAVHRVLVTRSIADAFCCLICATHRYRPSPFLISSTVGKRECDMAAQNAIRDYLILSRAATVICMTVKLV